MVQRSQIESVLKRMAILLIGSTGNGKSTLGNFLVNPDREHIYGEKQTFKTARTNKPETQVVKNWTFKVSLPRLETSEFTVIDTPGIFEDEDKDITHMVNIIKALHIVGEIRACVLVIKFSSKIDTPYRTSVRYYAKLLPGLFESNLIVVVTDYACDERSKYLRKLQEINEHQNKTNILSEVRDVCGIDHDPKLFTIDCLPVSDSEMVINRVIREEFIYHVFSLTSKSTVDLEVAKTDSIMMQDKLSIAKLEGEISAYEERLQQTSTDATICHSEIEQLANEEKVLEISICNIKEELLLIDTKELVEDDKWSVSLRWKWFKVLSRNFKVRSQYPIQDIDYWTNGRCSWLNRVQSDSSVEGTVKGKFMRGLYARVILKVYKCDKMKEEIERLRSDSTTKEELQQIIAQKHEYSKRKQIDLKEKMTILHTDIDKRKNSICRLSSEYLTIEECLERFNLKDLS